MSEMMPSSPDADGAEIHGNLGFIGAGAFLVERYRVGEPIGRGGMSMVFQGHDQLLDRTVAIKVLGLQAVSATGSRQEFMREARAAAALSHPNIVSVYDAGVHGAERFIIMEYVPGGSLTEIIQAEAPVAAARAVSIATQIADALDYGHRHGIVHCDVKPQNVLLDESGRPKLVDFGISRSIAATGALTDTISGTAGYIAPEQLLGERLDGRADIYALGCVIYELLTGKLPFEASNLAALATQRLVRPPVPLRQRNPRISPALADCVMRAIEREPDQRYPTARDFSHALEMGRTGAEQHQEDRPLNSTAVLSRRRPVAVPNHQPPPLEARGGGAKLFWPLTLAALGLLIVAGALVAIKLPSLGRPSAAPLVRVPLLTGQRLDQATLELRGQGLGVDVTTKDTTGSGTCTGLVLGQTPGDSVQLASGRAVGLVVSRNDQC